MSDELDRLRAWAAGEVCRFCAFPRITDAEVKARQWDDRCLGGHPKDAAPYDPRPAVLVLFGLLGEVAEELSRHGWGDFHYGSTGRQEPKVAALVARARAALQPAQADPNT